MQARVLPYVYKLVHNQTGEFYFGYREANKVPSSQDLGIKYFTSSKYIHEMDFSNFETSILAEFFDGFDAWKYEQNLIQEHLNNPLCINKSFFKNDASYLTSKRGPRASYNHRPRGPISTEEKIKRQNTTKRKVLEGISVNKHNSKTWVITFEDGREPVVTNRLHDWCVAHNINESSLKNLVKFPTRKT